MNRKQSISYPEDLHAEVEAQVDAGVSNNISEWFQEAAYQRLALQSLALEAQGGELADLPITPAANIQSTLTE